MNKFFDFLEMDLSLPVIRELGQYICRFVENFGGEIPVEGNMGKLSFCATGRGDGGVQVHWVQISGQRIAVEATI